MFDYLKWAFFIVACIIVGSYFFVLDLNQSVMYAAVDYMRIYYFSFMLLGATVAIHKRKSEVSIVKALLSALGWLMIYYICMGIYKLDPFYCRFQLISLLPLLFAIYWLYRLCETPQMQRLLQKKVGIGIYFISCLTLEIYMVQYAFFTDELNNIFPANLILIYAVIFLFAYCLRCASRLFSQVFSESPLNWRKVYQL